MEKITLRMFFALLSSKIKSCLLPRNKIASLGLQTANLFLSPQSQNAALRKGDRHYRVSKSCFSFGNLVMFILVSFFGVITAAAQTSPADCKLGCTSNDVQIQSAYLSDINGNKLPQNFVCPISGSAGVYLTLELTTKTPRIGVVIYTNIKNFTPPSTVGSLVTNFSECFAKNLNQPTNKVTFSKKFDWTCGTPIVLTEVFIGWGTGNTNFCLGSGFQCPATSSKCYQLPPDQYIPIVTPTANPASLTQCSTSPGGTTAVFDLTSLNSTVIGTQTNVNVTWYSDVNLNTQITSTVAAYISSSGVVYAKVTSTISPYPYSSVAVTLTVNPKPAVTTSNTASICSGTGPNISLVASTASSFSWTIGTITGDISGASAGSGTTINQTLTNPSNSSAGSVVYIVTPTSITGSCIGDAYSITVTVNPKPAVTTSNTASICSGTGPNISLAASTASSFSWTIGTITGNITGASAGSGTTINQTLTNPSNSSAGSVVYIVTPTSTTGLCAGDAYSITVTVNPKPVVTTSSRASICSGTGPNISLAASTASSFSWTIGTITGGITGASIGSGTTINQTLTNPSNSSAGSVVYIVTPTSTTGLCAGDAYSITVTVNPKPVVTTSSRASICSGTGPNISLAASTASSFSWTIGTITGGITGASIGSGTTINQTLTNPSNSSAGSVVYIVTPTSTAGSCIGDAYSIAVTVNPKPAVTTSNTASICSGTGPNISLAASTASSFSWTIGTITGSITGASAGSGTTINQTLTNPSNSTAGSVVYIVTPTSTAGSCVGAPYNITVTVNAIPAALSLDITQPSLCGTSTTGSIKVNNPTVGYTYTLFLNNVYNKEIIASQGGSVIFDGLSAGSNPSVNVKTDKGCISDVAGCPPLPSANGKIANTETKTTSAIVPIDTTVATTSKTASSGFDAYPVPFKDQLTVKYKFDYVSDVKIEVFNSRGISVLSKTDTGSYLNKEITLDLHGNKEKEQVYIVKLTTDRETSTKKVLSSK